MQGEVSEYPSSGMHRGKQTFPAVTAYASGPVEASVFWAAFRDFAKAWLVSPSVIPLCLVVAYFVGKHPERWGVALSLVVTLVPYSLGLTYFLFGPRVPKTMSLMVEPSGEVTSLFGGVALSLAPGTFVVKHRRDHVVLVPLAAGSGFQVVVPHSLLPAQVASLLERGTPTPWAHSAFLTTGPPRWLLSRRSKLRLLIGLPLWLALVWWLLRTSPTVITVALTFGSAGAWSLFQGRSLVRSARYLGTAKSGDLLITETDTCRLVTRVGSPWSLIRAAVPFPIDQDAAERAKDHRDALDPAWINPLTRLPVGGSQR